MNSKPYIIIFNVDQWRGDIMGHLGNPAAGTPNLDKLVEKDAVSFSNAFCQNPVCTPSRCSFMTGWYPHVRGHRTMHYMLHSERGEPNLLKILKENGYFIWWSFRNDLIPAQQDATEICDIQYFPSKEDLARWGHRWQPNLHVSTRKWRGKPDSDTYYSFFAGKLNTKGDDIYFDLDWGSILGAIDFIRDYNGEKPLCMYFALQNPHPPYGIEEPWFSKIDRKNLPTRIKTPKDWLGKPSLLKGIYEKQKLQDWTEDRWDELRATYYGMCSRLDYQFGLIMNELKKANFYDKSAIFFFSDHGDFTGDYGLVEKTQNTFEDCLTKIPFIIKLPKNMSIKPRVCNELIELIDFPATVYALTGIEPGYIHFGKSLLPILQQKSNSHRDAVFCEGGRLYGEVQAMEKESKSDQKPSGLYYPRISLQISDDGPYHGKAVMCRTKEFKYIRRLYEKDEFYDLNKDPDEMKNIIDDPDYAEVISKLKERMLTWYLETCDVVPLETDRRF